MGHSFRKTPVIGYRPTEKQVKRIINRLFRRKARHLLGTWGMEIDELSRLPLKLMEVFNERDMPKAPRSYLEWIGPKSKLMRK